MLAVLSFVHRLLIAAKGVIAIGTFITLLFSSFTLMVVQQISLRGNDLYPATWNSVITFFWQTGYILLPFLAAGIWLVRRMELFVIKRFLYYLNSGEKKILEQFISSNRIIGVPP